MNKIIKRLEIVKSAIELEDEEIIFQQVAHLKN
ncbi:molecular chaperone DnaJ, partial [Citrobacter freundii]